MARNILPLAAMEKLLKKVGAERVSHSAKVKFSEKLQEIGEKIGEKAIRFSKHSGRKTIKDVDIKEASK